MTPTLEGRDVRLEPLAESHLAGLEAIAFDASIWRYMNNVMDGSADLRVWFDTAKRLEAAGSGQPWTIILKASVKQSQDRIVGSTRFIDLDPHHQTVEIGNTWLDSSVQSTAINPGTKLLQLTYAFEELGLRRVGFKTHHENLRSQAAIRKLGAQYEGTFRNHYIMPNGSQRHSVWFSITREDWPQVKSQLEQRLATLSPPSS